MAKFKCTHSERSYVEVGLIVEGQLLPYNKQFKLTKDYPQVSQTFRKDMIFPFNGGLWCWTQVFEEAESQWDRLLSDALKSI